MEGKIKTYNSPQIKELDLPEIAKKALRHLMEENAKLTEETTKLTEVTTKDEKTGLLNSRGLREAAERVGSMIKRGGISAKIAFIDINNFKLVNDTLGHNIGDQFLIDIANALRNSVRKEDIVGRWGGDEFVILLVGKTIEEKEGNEKEGNEFVDRCSNMIKQLALKEEYKDVKGLGVSIGIADWETQNSFDEVLKMADTAMYINKTSQSKQK